MIIDDDCIKRIHVNQHKIRAGDSDPISVKYKGKTYPCSEIVIYGQCAVVYRPDKPLSCGARVWIETNGAVIAKDKEE